MGSVEDKPDYSLVGGQGTSYQGELLRQPWGSSEPPDPGGIQAEAGDTQALEPPLARTHIQSWVAGRLACATSSTSGHPTSIPFLDWSFPAVSEWP